MYIRIKNIIKNNGFILLILSLLFFSFFTTFVLLKVSDGWKPIKSDGIGYHSYLPSVFIYHDMDMKQIVSFFNKDSEPLPNSWLGIYKSEETGKYIDKYPMGVAVLGSPFFILADSITQLTNLPRDGFSIIYQIFNLISAFFYLVCGNLFLYKFLKKRVGEKSTLTTLILLNFGTNLIHYYTYDSSFSHVYSFAIIAGFLYFSEQFLEKKRWRYSIILGLLAGLGIMVRQTNVLIFLFLFLSTNNFNLKKIYTVYKPLFIKIIAIFLIAFIVFIPQMLYWKYVGNKFLLFSYPGEYFNFLHPEIFNTLFSVRKGLFFWSPLLLLVIPGFILMFRKKDKFSFVALLFFFIQIYLVSSWWAWSYGFSYGSRAFTETLAVLAIPIAYFIQSIFKLKNNFIKYFIFLILSFFLFLSLFQMQQYWRGIIKGDGTTLEDYTKIFLKPCLDSPNKALRCD